MKEDSLKARWEALRPHLERLKEAFEKEHSGCPHCGAPRSSGHFSSLDRGFGGLPEKYRPSSISRYQQ